MIRQISLALALVIFLVSFAFGQAKEKQTMAVVVAVSQGDNFAAAEMLTGKLKSERFRFISVSRAVVTGIDLNKMYDGDATLVSKVTTATKTTRVIVGQANYSFRKSEVAGVAMVVCDLIFSYKVMNQNGDILGVDALLQHGAGFSNSGALEGAIDHLAQMMTAKLVELP